jgi:hypothetical protein
VQTDFLPRRGIFVINALAGSRIEQLLAGKKGGPRQFPVFGLNSLKKFPHLSAHLAANSPVPQAAHLTLTLPFFRGTLYISQNYKPPMVDIPISNKTTACQALYLKSRGRLSFLLHFSHSAILRIFPSEKTLFILTSPPHVQ